MRVKWIGGKTPVVATALVLSLLYTFYCTGAGISGAENPPFGENAIRADWLFDRIRILASPEMEGRASGTPAGARAAAYIAEEFRKIGLQPLGDHGGYLQAFEVSTGIKLGKDNRLTLELPQAQKPYEAGSAFNPFGSSDEGQVSGEIVFAGYGITAPELHYDDYRGLNVRDKIVLVMTHEPQEKNQHGPFRSPEAFRYTEVRYKLINAREHGAQGIIVVADPNNHPGEKETLFAIRGGASASAGIFALNAVREIAGAILSSAGKNLAELQKEIDATLTPRSFLVPGAFARIQIHLIREKGQAANVIGILPGRDSTLKEEAIVIGAHYDHLGRGSENSLSPDRYGEIHPGADDNASGVAGLIGLARAFARAGAKRTLIFIAFSGEEMGLLGSSHYVKHPSWPLEKTYAMINMDMIGRLENNRLHVLGVDSAKEFRPLVDKVAKGSELELRLSGEGFGPSDQTSFYAKGIPVLMFFTGPHLDYHRPSDTADKINREGLEKVVELVFSTIDALSDQSRPLAFVKTKGELPRTGRGDREGYGPYFGSIPDFSESTIPGVRLSGVSPGSPAEKAGLKAGDIIVKFAGVTIRNLEDLVFALRSERPGDQVEVLYLREGKELSVQAMLEQRR